MSYSSSHGSVGDLSAFVASNAPAIKQEWEALLPQLNNSMNGKILVQELNHAPNFDALLEPIAQALAQYKIFPNIPEFIDTLALCTAEQRKPVPAAEPTPEMKMEQLWQIPTFTEDIRMVNRKSSLLSFKKMVDGAFMMIGRPSTQEIESKSSSKLAIPAGTLSSGGYSYANDAATIERAAKLEEARKTMFAKKPVVAAGVPATVTSFTPYQASFDVHPSQPAISMPNAVFAQPAAFSVEAPVRHAIVPGDLEHMPLSQAVAFTSRIRKEAPECLQPLVQFAQELKGNEISSESTTKHFVRLFALLKFHPTILAQLHPYLPPELLTFLASGQDASQVTPGQVFSEHHEPKVRMLLRRLLTILSSHAKLAQKVAQRNPKPSAKGYEQLLVKTLTGKTIVITDASPSSTVAQLKTMIKDKVGIIESTQRLIFAGKQLEDKMDLAAYGIRDGSYLHLVLRLRDSTAQSATSVPRFGAKAAKTPKARTPSDDSEDEDNSSDDDEKPVLTTMMKKKKAAPKLAKKMPAVKAKRAPDFSDDSDQDSDSSDDDEPIAKKKKKMVVPNTGKKMPVVKAKRAYGFSDDSDQDNDSSSDDEPIAKKKKMVVPNTGKKMPAVKAKRASGFSDDSDEDSDSYDGANSVSKATLTLKAAKADSSITKTKSSKSASVSSSASSLSSSLSPSWSKHDSVFVRGLNLVESKSVPASSRIAGFDMDSTLISVKSGAKFPKDANDWKWMCDAVVPKIRELQKDNFRIVIFTNQGGIESGKQKSSDILEKIDRICEALGEKEYGPIFALVATSKDRYRKPSPFLWDLFVQKMNQGVLPDATTFYVGDAAGRKKRDHSCADRSFAFNAGIRFMTEDAFFLGTSPQDIDSVPFPEDPIVAEFKRNVKSGYSTPYQVPVSSAPVEIVLTCGMPGSGKSTIYQQIFQPRGYVHVNLDTIKVAAKCLEFAKSTLNQGKSVVIDQTFPDVSSRAAYVELAKTLKIPIRIVNLQTPLPIAMHLNTIRSWTSDRKHVPDLVYHIFAKKYVAPTIAEGFDAVIDLPFQFTTTDPKVNTYLQWYTD